MPPRHSPAAFTAIVFGVYVFYVRDDPEWHRRVGRWLRHKLGVPEKEPGSAYEISWVELLMLLKVCLRRTLFMGLWGKFLSPLAWVHPHPWLEQPRSPTTTN